MVSQKKVCMNSIVDPHLGKRDAILVAARQVFLEMGYAAATMDAIAGRGNVSKATIYSYFSDKHTLFECVIQVGCRAIFTIADMPERFLDARSALRQYGNNLLVVTLDPEATAIHRAVIAETARGPEVGDAFYAAGPGPAHLVLTHLFEDLTRRGLLEVPQEERPLAAELFFGMLMGDVSTRALLNQPPRRNDNQSLIDLAVELIFCRYGPH